MVGTRQLSFNLPVLSQLVFGFVVGRGNEVLSRRMVLGGFVQSRKNGYAYRRRAYFVQAAVKAY